MSGLERFVEAVADDPAAFAAVLHACHDGGGDPATLGLLG